MPPSLEFSSSSLHALSSTSNRPPRDSQYVPYRLYFPVGSQCWNVRASPSKSGALRGQFWNGTTILACPCGDDWLRLEGDWGYVKRNDEVLMTHCGFERRGIGWYPVQYVAIHEGFSHVTATPSIFVDADAAQVLHHHSGTGLVDSRRDDNSLSFNKTDAGADPSAVPIPSMAPIPSSSHSSSSSTVPLPQPKSGTCAHCRRGIRVGDEAMACHCGHLYHYPCVSFLAKAQICPACHLLFAVGESGPPLRCPPPTEPRFIQKLHERLKFIPLFYRTWLIVGILYLIVACHTLLMLTTMLLRWSAAHIGGVIDRRRRRRDGDRVRQMVTAAAAAAADGGAWMGDQRRGGRREEGEGRGGERGEGRGGRQEGRGGGSEEARVEGAAFERDGSWPYERRLQGHMDPDPLIVRWDGREWMYDDHRATAWAEGSGEGRGRGGEGEGREARGGSRRRGQ